MSFNSDIMSSSWFFAELTAAGVVATTAQCYVGRRPRDKCDNRGEVWIERLPEQVEGWGFQNVFKRPYRVHYRYPLNAGGDRSGSEQMTHVEAKLQVIRARFQAAIGGLIGNAAGLFACEAVEDTTDLDPELPDTGERDILDGAVLVTFFVKE